jgi:hypothetical protein
VDSVHGRFSEPENIAALFALKRARRLVQKVQAQQRHVFGIQLRFALAEARLAALMARHELPSGHIFKAAVVYQSRDKLDESLTKAHSESLKAFHTLDCILIGRAK